MFVEGEDWSNCLAGGVLVSTRPSVTRRPHFRRSKWLACAHLIGTSRIIGRYFNWKIQTKDTSHSSIVDIVLNRRCRGSTKSALPSLSTKAIFLSWTRRFTFGNRTAPPRATPRRHQLKASSSSQLAQRQPIRALHVTATGIPLSLLTACRPNLQCEQCKPQSFMYQQTPISGAILTLRRERTGGGVTGGALHGS